MNSTRFTNPAAVILAAGRSSRMGATKPLMLIDDMPMLMYAANAFRAAGIDYIIVVTGFDAERVAALAREGALHPVHNSNFDKGMFTSVCAGIEAVPDEFDSAFVLPVDIPFVSPETLKRLQTSANREHGASAKERGAPSAGGMYGMPAAARSRPIVIPRHTGKPGHPPLIHRSIFGQLRGWRGPHGLGGFLKAQSSLVAYLDVEDPFILRDIDTPDDMQKIISDRNLQGVAMPHS